MGQRTALVTGGSRGIGAEVVKAFSLRGLDVVFTYQSASAAAADVVDACRDLPGQVVAVQYDLLRSDAAALVEAVADRFGGLHSVVLNAGLWKGGRLDRRAPDDWWQTVEENLRGTARLAASCVPAFSQQGDSSLVLMSSAVAVVGFPGDTAYGAAKSGLIGFARSLAKEVGRNGVRVNVLAPGFVKTDMTDGIPDKSRDHILSRTVLGRFAEAGEIARAALFLSEDATFCTGVVLSADGGWTL